MLLYAYENRHERLNRQDRGLSHRDLSRGAPPTLSVAPTDYPCTVDEAKLAAYISGSDVDSLVQGWIAAATEIVQIDAELSLATQTRVQYLDDFPDGPIELRMPPVASVTSVQYYDLDGTQQTLSPTLYQADLSSRPGLIIPAYSQIWPVARCQLQSVAVTFVCGAPTAGILAIAKQCIYLRAAAMYRNREMMAEETTSYDNLLDKIRWRKY